MGSLIPGATYIYEHVNGITYRRETGSPPASRVEVGRIVNRVDLDDQLAETALWQKIHRAAKSDTALQDALERVKILYYLSTNDTDESNI